MKFSRRWLEHMLEQATGGTDATAVSLEFLLERLTLAGLEVDGVEHEALDEAIVVGMITEARQHPDADRLRVCTVDIGQEPLEIVCGAPNARAGIHVAV
ncbi:MAG: phenylalanine--tRNA ligase subunit beta, partial [Pseudomonadota bacterium]